jgi:hypothetical protein
VTYAPETVNRNEIQEPQEELIAHEDGHEKVTQDDCTEVVLRIRELADGSQHDADPVQCRHKREELAICVEPELEPDPPADFPGRPLLDMPNHNLPSLWLRRLSWGCRWCDLALCRGVCFDDSLLLVEVSRCRCCDHGQVRRVVVDALLSVVHSGRREIGPLWGHDFVM